MQKTGKDTKKTKKSKRKEKCFFVQITKDCRKKLEAFVNRKNTQKRKKPYGRFILFFFK